MDISELVDTINIQDSRGKKGDIGGYDNIDVIKRDTRKSLPPPISAFISSCKAALDLDLSFQKQGNSESSLDMLGNIALEMMTPKYRNRPMCMSADLNYRLNDAGNIAVPTLTSPGRVSVSSSSSDDAVLALQEKRLSFLGVKAKRKRASRQQLQYLCSTFEKTPFPTTEMRAKIGRLLGMHPRSVQIWFQNKRQATKQNMDEPIEYEHGHPPHELASSD